MLTLNEKRVLRFLAASVGKDYSINEIAKECKLTPYGAYKLLSKFEKEGILRAKTIANIKAYKLDFEDEKTSNVLNLAFASSGGEGRVKLRAEDLKPLKKVTKACVLFGSYITAKQHPADLDVLFVLEKKNFNEYKQTAAKVQDILPIKMQDVVQTPDDLKENLKKNDLVIIKVIKEGIVLWGCDALAQVIRNAHR